MLLSRLKSLSAMSITFLNYSCEMTDDQYELIFPLIPKPKSGGSLFVKLILPFERSHLIPTTINQDYSANNLTRAQRQSKALSVFSPYLGDL